MHFSVVAMTVAGTWSLLHFLNNLQANACVTNLTVGSHMLATSKPRCPRMYETFLSCSLIEPSHSFCLKISVKGPPLAMVVQ
jgi:hypothetical protein